MRTFFGGIFIETSELKKEGIDYPIELEYYKIKEENQFGIEIIKKEHRTQKINIEKQELKSLSKDECKINRMLELFKQNEVTPISAGEIIEDFFGKTLAKTSKVF